jgi:undecaprenyl pyrophosphate phosphatase UppP
MPVLVAAIFAGTGIPLWFFDYLSRKLKAMYDWKWLDASVVGLIQATTLVPGWDQLGGAYLGASFLNYKRESAAKYAYFAIVPILFVKVVSSMKAVSFGTSAPSADLSWLSFGVAFIVALFSGLLAIGGFMKHVQTRGMGQYVIYRWLLAAGVCGAYWFRGHS